jgi:hypothetical protein
MVLDVLEIGHHCPMMRPVIGHEIMQFFAGEVAAMTAEVKRSVAGALSEFTLFDPIIGPVAEATITVCRPACAAIEATGTAFQGFHRKAFRSLIPH